MKTQKTPTTISEFIKALKDVQFDIHYSDSENPTTVLEKIGEYQLEFILHFEAVKINVSPETHDTPETYDVEYHNGVFEEVAVYGPDGLQEPTRTQLSEISTIIYYSIY